MTPEEFMNIVKENLLASAVESSMRKLISPAGRNPPADTRARSEWYNNLSPDSKNAVREIVSDAAFTSLFRFFAVLDGARTVDRGNGRFELYYVLDGKKFLLNPEEIDLHDILADNV